MNKKLLIIFLVLYSAISYGKGEISFFKQEEKIEKGRAEKLKNLNKNIEDTENKLEIYEKKEKINMVTDSKRNFDKKLVEYIKTQNPKLSKVQIQYILDNVWKYSKQYDFNPYIILAVMNIESHFNHNTVSKAGARGLMQLMPFNFKEFNVNNSVEGNILGGVLHLKRDFERTNNLAKTLICYNAGCGRLKNNEWKNIKETREYVPKVLKKYKELIKL